MVSLRRQKTGDKKNADEWMLDYALQKVVGELAPTQKQKVALLVKAFILSLLRDSICIWVPLDKTKGKTGSKGNCSHHCL
ncbi:hypothetical protein L1887_39872 [Cichorium endivia]|nr:hypothetical protein L1887_39872 [Cichorium endivia]